MFKQLFVLVSFLIVSLCSGLIYIWHTDWLVCGWGRDGGGGPSVTDVSEVMAGESKM